VLRVMVEAADAGLGRGIAQELADAAASH